MRRRASLDAANRGHDLQKKGFPAFFLHAESGTRPDSASPDQAPLVLDARRAIRGPHRGVQPDIAEVQA
jgi:hypothetical protein